MRRLAGLAVVAVLAGCQALPVVETTSTSATTTSTTTTTSSTTTTTLQPVVATGRVVDGGGRPIPGVSVAFVESVTTTGADGGFEVEASRAGPIVLTKAGLTTVEAEWSGAPLEQVMSPSTIRGIRVGAGAAGSDEHFQRLIDLATVTSVNAFVFDTKQEGGQVLYDTRVQQAHDIGAVDVWYDAAERISRAEAAGLYTITRIVALEDAFWVRAHPEEKMAGPWADPTGPGIRRYVTDLAVEACELGFDEIQLDYVRYAAGSTASVTGQLSLSQEDRVANVASLIEEVRAAVSPLGCALSADIFGIVVSVRNDQGLGQRPEELSPHLEAVSPMVYPSHYSDGWLGYPDPNARPYEVTARALDDALPRVNGGAVLRPWLQAFSWSPSQIREAIRAAEERGVGWMLWNVGSSFDPAAIPTDEELGG